MNESWSTYEWAMSHTWISHVTRMNKSCHTYEWVMSHTWISHVTHMNESCNTLQSSLFHMYSRLKSDHAVIRDMTHPYVTWRIHHVTWIFCPGGVVKTHRQQWSEEEIEGETLCAGAWETELKLLMSCNMHCKNASVSKMHTVQKCLFWLSYFW